MWHLEAAKEQKLADTLMGWHRNAKAKSTQLHAQLNGLQEQAASLAATAQEAPVMSESPAALAPLVRLLGCEPDCT